MRVAVIGAGLAGLSAASTLCKAGRQVTVFEKSRGVGGRLSTRQTRQGYTLNHGAPVAEGGSAAWRAFCKRAEAEGNATLAPKGRLGSQSDQAVVGRPTMTHLPRHLAKGLEIKLQTEISRLQKQDANYHLIDTSGEILGPFDRVLLAAPALQTRRLLETLAVEDDRLNGVVMSPCWTVLLVLSNSANIDVDRLTLLPQIDTIAKTDSLSADDPSVDGNLVKLSIHMTTEWSQEHLELQKDDALAAVKRLIESASDQTLSDVKYEAAHRWRYATVAKPVGHAAVSICNGEVLAAGDWCLGATAGAALDSGLAAAEILLRGV